MSEAETNLDYDMADAFPSVNKTQLEDQLS